MPSVTPPDSQGQSTRPYLIRALHDWCTDNGFTPYLAVHVDRSVQVPMEYVKNGEIVLNVGFEATSGLKLGNDFVEFKARFGGVPREIVVPVDHVVAIYARENGQGMAFPTPPGLSGRGDSPAVSASTAVGESADRALRGLRLAGAEATPVARPSALAAATGPVLVGKPEAAVEKPRESSDLDPPPDPSPPPAGRAALKRVK
jgi:stringent starvation protein B